jgi:hypothetical protein
MLTFFGLALFDKGGDKGLEAIARQDDWVPVLFKENCCGTAFHPELFTLAAVRSIV